MAPSQPSGFKRFIFWDYPRASWQYDVMVALILLFVFVTPREWFRDTPKVGNIVRMPDDAFWLEPSLLASVSPEQRHQRAAELVQQRVRGAQPVARLVPIFDAEGEIKGYMAFTKP